MSTLLKPAQTLRRVHKRLPIDDGTIEQFDKTIDSFIQQLNANKSEENGKGFFRDFLVSALYPAKKYVIQQDYHGIDLTIHLGEEKNAQVLFETKGVGRQGMISTSTLCRKAMYELVLYYIREEFVYKNHEIKHLVITDFNQIFIFDKSMFYNNFGSKHDFVAQILAADKSSDTTDYIYNQIIKPRVEAVESQLSYTYIVLNDLKKKTASRHSKELALKTLSPVYMLNLSLPNADHNTLNTSFYNELLYIMGVCEVKGKKVKQIVRLAPNKRQEASFLEQTMHELECYNINSDEEKFDIAIGLVINWINRVLFLKLLESRLISWNYDGKQERILTINRIPDYHTLNDLFWHVLAKNDEQRSDTMRRLFSDIPYLNSSLFEVSYLEQKYFRINSLNDKAEMDIMPSTVLRDGNGRKRNGKIRTIDYLFCFLDAYDFGTNAGNDGSVAATGRTLIDASVLGLIFEKINGYKEGSFFTPGYITEYICHSAIRRVVTDKINEHFSLSCQSLNELKSQLDVSTMQQRDEINSIINSIRLCDPAVGSGHFLVSALNEIIAIKSYLGVLQYQDDDSTRQPLRQYSVEVDDDELSVVDAVGNEFCYIPSHKESLKVQRMLFEEKKTIIENCLFGVDVNPKSVEICRLRLWIELLKNAYYFRDNMGNVRLQTLPNIDLNIKVGDSLASRIPVKRGRQAYSSSYFAQDVDEYRRNVAEYKNCDDKDKKHQLNRTISKFKRSLLLDVTPDAFSPTIELTDEQRFWQGAMEWMIEFPDVLDLNGAYEGFDLVVGNPPYISLKSLRATPYYRKMRTFSDNCAQMPLYATLDGQGDIYSLFVERALMILKSGGLLSFIIPNKWMQTGYGASLRRLFCEKELISIVDFVDNQVFDTATTYTAIVALRNNLSHNDFLYHRIDQLHASTLQSDIDSSRALISKQQLGDSPWPMSSRGPLERIWQAKSNPAMTTIGEAINNECYFGILSGKTDVFNEISPLLCHQFISECPKAVQLLRPIISGREMMAFKTVHPVNSMLLIRKEFTLQGMQADRKNKPSESEAWAWLKENYPPIARYLEPFANECRARDDKGDYWWELRACDYYDRFLMPKIYYQAIATRPCFVYDESDTICNNSIFILSTQEKGYEALFNSAVGWWLIGAFCPLVRGGRQLSWDNFRQIPVPKVMPQRLRELSDAMHAATDSGQTEEQHRLMNEINSLCASLYGLTDEELQQIL